MSAIRRPTEPAIAPVAPWFLELRSLVRLALPIVAVQLGLMTMGVVDLMVIGRVSSDAMAAVGLGNSYSFLWCHFGIGLLLVLDPVLSQAYGAADQPAITRGIQRGAILALLVTLLTLVPWLLTAPALELIRQPAALVPATRDYVFALIPGLPAFFLFGGLRQTLQVLHRLRALLLVTLAANLANLGLDLVLVYGWLGLPALGVTGCGLATSVCRWLMLGGLLALAWPDIRPHVRTSWRDAWALRPLLRLLELGVPIGLQLGLEAAAFVTVTFCMGLFGKNEIAGHQVAINLASLSFMLPLGISSAAAVRVGFHVGRGSMPDVRAAARLSLLFGGGVMLLSAALFATIPELLARIYTGETDVLVIAVALLPLAALFQVFDGLQVVGAGVLRGIGDTRWPLWVQLGGFWVAGVPLGCLLAFTLGQRHVGLWWGLVSGLFVVAAVFLLRIQARLRGDIARLHVEAPPDQATEREGAA